MARITVDIEKMRQAADELQPPAQELPEKGARLFEATNLENFDPRYAAQLSAKVRDEGAYAQSEASRCAKQYQGFSQRLRDIAQRFEAADLDTCQDMEAAYAALQEAIAAQAETPFAPDWLIKGECPPWLDPWAWLAMSPAQREQQIETYRLEWAKFLAGRTTGSFRSSQQDTAYLEEMFQIYLFGLPAHMFQEREVTDRSGRSVTITDQTEAYLPKHDLFSKPVLPDGHAFNPNWRWQYQNLPAMMDEAQEIYGYIPASIEATIWRRWSSHHFNLCGENAVGHAVGVEHMADSYLAMADVLPSKLIQDAELSPYQVSLLYKQLGWETEIVGPFQGSELHWDEWSGEPGHIRVVPGMEEVSGYLRKGYAITALVGVDSGPDAALSSTSGAVGHYVNVLETFTTKDGVEIVRVYSSLEHREEIYTWEHFQATWGKWENVGGNSAGQAIIARPGDGG